MPTEDHVFSGDSELARRMRALDWSKTLLGPVERWPQPLRACVDVSLNCAFPIAIWWGPELALLYNDEYRAFLGGKHPRALASPGAEVWSEIWHVVGPMLARVMECGESTRSRDLQLEMNREGYIEETYFSFSYSPIHDEKGRIGGVFCPVIETTDKVLSERRLRTLRDLGAACTGVDTEAGLYKTAAGVLANNPYDVPFAVIYRVADDRKSADLEATAGIEPGAPGAPRSVSLVGAEGHIWSLAEVARSGAPALVHDVSAFADSVPTGAWSAPPHSALVLPVLLPGQHQAHAIFVAAVSPRRALDGEYRVFFDLLATQIASGLADARSLEEERRRAEALAEIDRAKTAFFSNVSHEFRTPLTLLLGPLQDVLSNAQGPLPPKVAETLTLAHRNSLRLLRLVNTLLDFSRIEAGRSRASYAPTDLAALTRDLASAFRSVIERGGLRFEVECPPLPEPVFVDRDMWEKIVLNLLSNAFKFTFEGSIEVALHGHGDHVKVVFKDTGTGIPEHELPQIFDRFHRVEGARARTHEGSGIGLALVHELVKLHGGRLTVESRLGAGTVFTVAIPFGKAHLPEDRIDAARTLASTATGAEPFVEEALRWLPVSPAGPSITDAVDDEGPSETSPTAGRVLVADDNADMRAYLTRLLRQHWTVSSVPDGAAALAAAVESPPDVILSDVMMPNLDGFGLLRALRKEPRTEHIPVIMLSARAGEESRIEGLAVGADDYLVKPFAARELIARVQLHMESARARRKIEEQAKQLALANEEAERARTVAVAANRAKDEFLAMLGHELRNPLSPIIMALELMRMRSPMTQEQQIIQRQLSHLVRLVDDLLDVSRIAQGKVELRKQRLELSQVVVRGLEIARPVLEQRRQNVDSAVPSEGLPVEGDPDRLAQVVSNLLTNAAKFSEPGRTVHITAERLGRLVRLQVRDEGAGIEPQMLARIFSPFVQQQSLARRGGLGLGLAIVKSLVELHEGQVTAFSEGPGKGSAFVVDLPLLAVPELSQADSGPGSGTSPGDGAADGESRILIVDDNVDAAETIGAVLKHLGYTVQVTHDGHTALKVARAFKPNACLLDIGLPSMSGYDLARSLRQCEGLPADLRIIAVTGYGREADRRRSEEAGFDDHVVKPADIDTIRRVLARPVAGPATAK